MNAIVLVDKPAGISSAEVVRRVKSSDAGRIDALLKQAAPKA
jgi:hypothetical protein